MQPTFDMLSSTRGPHTLRSFLLEGLAPPPTWTGDNAIELIVAAACLLESASAISRAIHVEGELNLPLFD